MAKVEISKRLVLINAASSVVVRVVNVSVLLWLQQYLLKRISAEEYSLLPVLSSVIVFLPLLTIVFSAGLQRYVTEAYARGDERRVTQIVSTMVPLHVAGGVAILLVGGILTLYTDSLLVIAADRLREARLMMALMVISLALPFMLAPYSVGLYVRQKFVLANLLVLGQEFLRLGLLFVLIFGVGVSVVWVVVASVAASVVGVAVNQVISRRLVPALKFRVSEIRWGMARELTTFGGWSVIGNLGEMIRMSSIPIILNRFASAVAVNSFAVGFLPYTYLQQFCTTAERAVMPQLTAMHAIGSKDRLRSAYLRGGRYVLWLMMAAAVPLMVFNREVLQLYLGERYELYADAGIVILLTLATIPPIFANVMLGDLAIATAQIRWYSLLAMFTQLLNVGLMLLFIGVWRMGAVGAALATFVSMGIVYPALSWPLGLRLADLRFLHWMRESVVPGILPAVASGGLLAVLTILVHPATWLALGLCTAAGMVVYLLVLFACMQPVDWVDLNRITARFPWLPAVLGRWIQRRNPRGA